MIESVSSGASRRTGEIIGQQLSFSQREEYRRARRNSLKRVLAASNNVRAPKIHKKMRRTAEMCRVRVQRAAYSPGRALDTKRVIAAHTVLFTVVLVNRRYINRHERARARCLGA